MSTQINQQVLKNFIYNKLGSLTINKASANELDIDNKVYQESDVDESGVIEIDEALDNEDLYELFATMYVQENDKEQAVKDKEEEKEEQTKVKDKSDSKA